MSSTEDARGNITTYTRDAEGRATAVQGPDPTANPQRYSYDSDGNLASITTPGGVTTDLTYDLREHLTKRTTPVGSWTYTYDPEGRQISQTAPSGRQATMTWEPQGLVSISYNDGTPTVTYINDLEGDRLSATTGSDASTVTYQYNALHEVSSAIVGRTDDFSYFYDNDGRLVGTNDQTLSYDQDGRITQAADSSGTLATYAYDDATGTATTTLPSGVVNTERFDTAGRPIETKAVKGSTTLTRSSYTLDPDGNPTQIVNADGTTDSFVYDANNRLTEVCYAASSCTGAANYVQWSYDADGDRTSQVTPSGTTNYTYNAADQVTNRSGADGAATYSYDNDGNLTTAGATTYTWNAAGQLLSSTTGRTTTSYGYDANNHRIAVTGSAATTDLIDPTTGHLVIERDSRGNTLRQYFYGASLLGFVSGGARYNYLTDAQSNIRGVTDSTGAAQLTYNYAPFGKLHSGTTGHKAPTNPLQFAGAYNDGTTYLMGAREYLPDLGRFNSLDPIGQTPAYDYGNDNPLAFTDPTGLSGENWVTRNAAAEAGGIGGYGAPQGNCSTAVQCAAMYNTTAPLVTKAEAIAISQQPGAGCWTPKGSCSGAVVGNGMADASGLYGLSTAVVVGGSSLFIGSALVYGGAIDYGAAALGVSLLGVAGVVTGGLVILGGLVVAGMIVNQANS